MPWQNLQHGSTAGFTRSSNARSAVAIHVSECLILVFVYLAADATFLFPLVNHLKVVKKGNGIRSMISIIGRACKPLYSEVAVIFTW